MLSFCVGWSLRVQASLSPIDWFIGRGRGLTRSRWLFGCAMYEHLGIPDDAPAGYLMHDISAGMVYSATFDEGHVRRACWI